MATEKARILNPNGSFGITSLKQAKRHVRRGRAVFIQPGIIRFIVHNHQNEAASKSEIQRSEKNAGYDSNTRLDFCTRNELKHLPFVGNIDRLMGRGKQRRKGAAQIS